MALSPGDRLGPYEIVAPIGAGGMGEVYRAKDTRLGRDVAVKVLPLHLSSNPEIRARFEREAKTVSSLSHPNICTLHDVGREGEADYLVMELMEGETLAQRLMKGALSLADVLKYGAQIADALDRAHRAGVMHRDLKPGNVMLTKSGAKLMDFGLARATGLGAVTDLTSSPTMAGPLTAEGTILGTFQYMAPEQLEGQEADTRADLWALGCVLYEMATGKRAFEGKSQASLITAIMGGEPAPISQLSPLAPPALDRLVGACLAKDPSERIQSAHDVKLQLQWLAAGGSPTGVAAPGMTAAPRRPWLPVALVTAALVVGTFIGARVIPWRSAPSTPSSGWSSATVIAKSLLTDIPGVQSSPNLAPDGKSFLFVSRGRVDDDIFLLRVGGENPVNLTEGRAGGDYEPAFSPDGERIAFVSAREGGGIFVMGATGESPKKLTSEGAHPAWSPDGRKIVYSTERVDTPYTRHSTASLWVVDLAGGDRKRLFEGDAAEPAWSPSGQRIAFWAVDQGQRDIRTIPAEGGPAIAVTNDIATDWGPFWAPDGRSLFFVSDRGGSPDLWRIAIDDATGEVRGEPEPVTSGVAPVMAGSISADGKRVAVEIGESRGELLRMSFDPTAARVRGEPVSIFASANPMEQLDLSADGRWIAYRTTSTRESIFVMRSDGADRRRLTDDAFRNRGPIWIRGEWVMFYSNRGGSYELWLMRQDGTELRVLTKRPDLSLAEPVVSPDGTRIAMAGSAGAQPKLGLAQVQESWFTPGKAPVPIVIEVVPDGLIPVSWSPDGKSIVGFGYTPQGLVPATYSLASQRVEPHAHLAASVVFGLEWLPDSRRLLYWDALRNTAVVADVDARESRDVAGIPGPCEMRLSADGHTLLLNRMIYEGDVWLLTLE